MHKAEVKGGSHREVVDKSLDVDTVKLLKTQDMGYIVHKKSVDDKKIERLKENLHMVGQERVNSHLIFVDSEKELENFNAAEHFDTLPELVDRTYNRIRKSQLSENVLIGAVNQKSIKRALRQREAAYEEVNLRTKRREKIQQALQHLQVQRNVMGKGSKRKIQDAQDGKPAVFKWKRERTR